MFKNKKFLKPSLLLFFILIISITAVSANNTSNFNTNLSDSNSVSETISLTDTSNSTGSISDLQNLIDKDTTGNISLDRNYTYNSVSDENKTEGVSVTKNLTINGNGYTLNGNNQSCIFDIGNCTVSLNDMNFINGNCKEYSEGTIYAENSTLSIDNCNFTNNTEAEYGGAIFTYNTYLILTNSVFTGNDAIKGGGSIFIYKSNGFINNSKIIGGNSWYGPAIQLSNGSLTINNSQIINTTGEYCGALFMNDGTVIIDNSQFTDNNGGDGGAIYFDKCKAIINNSQFTNNSAYWGGAIFSEKTNLNITSSQFNSNNVNFNGGAIYNIESNLNINNSLFMNNKGLRNESEGGAISTGHYMQILDKWSWGNLSCTNSNFTSNSANYGGAISAKNSSVILFNNSFNFNTANSSGSAIYNILSDLNLSNNVLANNTCLNPENITNVIYNNGTLVADYNWWGTNNNPKKFITNIANCTLNNWIIMTLNISPLTVYIGEITDIYVSLNQYTDGNLTYNMTSNIPEVLVTYDIVSLDEGLNETDSYMTENNTLITYYKGTDSGRFNITFTIDNQSLNEILTVNPLSDKTSFLSLCNYNFVYGNNTFMGELSDAYGNLLEDKNVSLNLTNYRNGAWKIYNVTTGEDGEFLLPITLAPGIYGVNATFNGDSDYDMTTSTVYMDIANAIIKTEDLKINHTSGNKFNGTITTLNGTPIRNANIYLSIIRLSDGEHKTYTVTSNSKGEFSLAINLASGNYYIQTSYQTKDISAYTENYISINPKSTDAEDLSIIECVYSYSIKNLLGQLYFLVDDGNLGISHTNVTLELTRNSDGASKNYTVTTNDNGEFNLPINLAKGDYTYHSTYTGTNIFQESAFKGSFTIEN